MEQGHGDTETQLQQAKSEAKKCRDELTSTSTKLKQVQSQVEQLNKAAVKNNASSYQQSIQLESQVATTSNTYLLIFPSILRLIIAYEGICMCKCFAQK